MLERRAGWRELKAVQRDRIFIADGNLYFNRPGLASSKVWKCWLRSFTPSYSLPAMKGKVGCTTWLSRES
jgi:ABC-type Fe3+-citrate transport system substrate-binding protein